MPMATAKSLKRLSPRRRKLLGEEAVVEDVVGVSKERTLALRSTVSRRCISRPYDMSCTILLIGLQNNNKTQCFTIAASPQEHVEKLSMPPHGPSCRMKCHPILRQAMLHRAHQS